MIPIRSHALALSLASSLAALVLALAGRPAAQGEPASGQDLRTEADRHWENGSYALALEAYEALARQLEDPAGEEARWIAYRIGDSRWRSAAATDDPDRSRLEAGRDELMALLEDRERPESHDRAWAEAHESLGDFHWQQRRSPNWGAAWQHYQPALDWWAGSSDLELARERYLDLVFTGARPSWMNDQYGYGSYGNTLPREVLVNASKLARTSDEIARTTFLLAVHDTRYVGTWRAWERALAAYDRVIELGHESELFDDALFASANLFEERGRPVRDAAGNQRFEPDHVEALARYRRLIDEFPRGASRYRRQAEDRVRAILATNVQVRVDRFFLPGSEADFQLFWRNAEQVELALFPIELTRDVRLAGDDSPGDWIETIALEELEATRRWTHATGDEGDHVPGSERITLEPKLEPGVWVLQARARGQESRALVLVGDAALTVKEAPGGLLAWFTDVTTGEPIGEAALRAWVRYYDGDEWRWSRLDGASGEDGTAWLATPEARRSGSNYLLVASDGERQAFVAGSGPSEIAAADQWRFYVYSDRAAYRPLDTAAWKVVARRHDGTRYTTPAEGVVSWELRDPRGNVTAEGDGLINAFGSFSEELETTEAMPLGEYRVRFFTKGKHDFLGETTVFRLEEYELPEFEVTVDVPKDEAGRARVFRLGDHVEASVQADYYYGAPVAGAEVEVFVYQRPHWQTWEKEREFPWYFEAQTYRNYWRGPGQQVAHLTLRTDAEGNAVFGFDTAETGGQDFEYTIQARVVDASRREVTSEGSVRVTQREYQVYVEAEHAIHRPGADVDLELVARDANGNPVQDDGRVEVFRERWVEIWVGPQDRELFGEALDARRREGVFPPPGSTWRLKHRGYQQESVAEGELRLGEDGRALWSFRPDTDGTYRVRWRSQDSAGSEVTADLVVFVADEDSRDLGYLPGGVEIIVDKDTFRAGETAAVMLVTDTSGRWVLFTVEGAELMHHEVLHLNGTAKLLQLPIAEDHVPDVYLGAVTVTGGNAYTARAEVVVPPVEHFLDVDVSYEAPTFEPGSEGDLSIVVRDLDGNPVEVELGVAVVDESVSYIQQDYAGDPRRFFFGQRRGLRVNTRGTFHHGRFVRLTEEGEETVDRRFEDQSKEEGGRRDYDELRQKSANLGAPGAAAESDMLFEAEAAGRSAPAAVGADGWFLGGAGGGGAVTVRSDFRDTAVWLPHVRTDAEGRATVSVPFPDSTTRWKATVRAASTGAQFGLGTGSARTRLPLIARLQAPRFFQVGDVVTVSGNLDNNTDADLRVQAALQADGLALLGRLDDDGELRDEPATVTIPARGSTRVDWRVRVDAVGEAVLTLAARGEEYADAMQRTLPVHAHGIEAFVATSGKLDGDDGEIVFGLDLPAERAPGSTTVEVQVTPSLAITMLDALPYLIDYPYGCTEQTLSRFMPSVVVSRTLTSLGLSPEDVATRVFGGIEEEFAGATHPKGKRSLDELDAMVAQGLERLYDFQHADGGWGWWKPGDSDPYMTAYVVWGLSLARDAGVDVRDGVLQRGAAWLAERLVESENRLDLQAWMLHALVAQGIETGRSESAAFAQKAYDSLWRGRGRLNAYSRALLTLAAAGMGRDEDARVLVDNLVNGVSRDESVDTSIVAATGGGDPYTLATAHWGSDGIWNRWSDGPVETTAFALRAILAVDPEHELVEPVMNWLVTNRRGAQWSNTRDTSIVVLALNDYLRRSGELESGAEYTLAANGVELAHVKLAPEALLWGRSRFEVPAEALRDGRNELSLRRLAGDGPLYFGASASFFSLEEPIPARGETVFVRREYYELVPRPTLLKGTVYDRRLVQDGDRIESGRRIEVVLTIEAKNELEYMLFEDLKPAGFEAVQVRSGEPLQAYELRMDEVERRFAGDAEAAERRRGGSRDALRPDTLPGTTGRTRALHQELRDRKVALFMDRLPEGFWQVRYDLRAQVPGDFHALPLLGHAMYVPEIRCNGEELRVAVIDG